MQPNGLTRHARRSRLLTLSFLFLRFWTASLGSHTCSESGVQSKTHYSQLPTPYSQLTTPNSLLPTHYSQLTTHTWTHVPGEGIRRWRTRPSSTVACYGGWKTPGCTSHHSSSPIASTCTGLHRLSSKSATRPQNIHIYCGSVVIRFTA